MGLIKQVEVKEVIFFGFTFYVMLFEKKHENVISLALFSVGPKDYL